MKCAKSPPFHTLITFFSPPLAIWRKPSLTYPKYDIMTPLAHTQLPAKYSGLHSYYFFITFSAGVIFIITILDVEIPAHFMQKKIRIDFLWCAQTEVCRTPTPGSAFRLSFTISEKITLTHQTEGSCCTERKKTEMFLPNPIFTFEAMDYSSLSVCEMYFWPRNI